MLEFNQSSVFELTALALRLTSSFSPCCRKRPAVIWGSDLFGNAKAVKCLLQDLTTPRWPSIFQVWLKSEVSKETGNKTVTCRKTAPSLGFSHKLCAGIQLRHSTAVGNQPSQPQSSASSRRSSRLCTPTCYLNKTLTLTVFPLHHPNPVTGAWTFYPLTSPTSFRSSLSHAAIPLGPVHQRQSVLHSWGHCSEAGS